MEILTWTHLLGAHEGDVAAVAVGEVSSLEEEVLARAHQEGLRRIDPGERVVAGPCGATQGGIRSGQDQETQYTNPHQLGPDQESHL